MIVTAYSSIEGAIEAMRFGAFHYIPKPFQNEEVLLTLRKGSEARRLTEENRRLREELSQRYGLGRIVGKSSRDAEGLRARAPGRPVAVHDPRRRRERHRQGARGARDPHALAPVGRAVRDGQLGLDAGRPARVEPLRPRPGAFTGAVANKKGLFEAADGGSIFFDEIGTVSLETQAKLLRVIQEKEFMRVGSVDTQKVDVRIIAATNVDLKKMVAEGRFRDDLYYRLCVITISIPAAARAARGHPAAGRALHAAVRLGEREADRRHRARRRTGRSSTTTGPATCASSRTRSSAPSSSARTAARSGSTCCPRRSCTPDRGELPVRLPENGATYKQLVEDYERRLIRTALRRTGGVQKRAAELLKIKPTTLHEIIKRLEIRRRRDEARTDAGGARASARTPTSRQPPHHHQRPVVREGLALRRASSRALAPALASTSVGLLPRCAATNSLSRGMPNSLPSGSLASVTPSV